MSETEDPSVNKGDKENKNKRERFLSVVSETFKLPEWNKDIKKYITNVSIKEHCTSL